MMSQKIAFVWLLACLSCHVGAGETCGSNGCADEPDESMLLQVVSGSESALKERVDAMELEIRLLKKLVMDNIIAADTDAEAANTDGEEERSGKKGHRKMAAGAAADARGRPLRFTDSSDPEKLG